jgi:hypothetical protein
VQCNWSSCGEPELESVDDLFTVEMEYSSTIVQGLPLEEFNSGTPVAAAEEFSSASPVFVGLCYTSWGKESGRCVGADFANLEG